MNKIRRLLLIPVLLLSLHAVAHTDSGLYSPRLKTFYDSSRHRKIPVAIYEPKNGNRRKQQIAILNHGYSPENPIAYLAYSYIANFLVARGFYVISIQQDQPEDGPMPREGNLQILRRPFWETGVKNILLVLDSMKLEDKNHNYNKLVLIGHSNGGDIAALFATEHPGYVSKLVTLDNRRMALPRKKNLKVLSLRSADQPADEGVLPSDTDLKKYEMAIIKLPINHNDMDDDASPGQRKVICSYLNDFL